ncbi:Uu.00g017880.m01.CDS01 [Anthostomella pinea]|uniref:Large ribosomal subunit protein mL44 n=1 Tax=Anthostomella pinea TaxID=933095 RepID=A0AAI8YQI3_9PEZI|nr:Uu.00g017880.m01.CDS01 [Anthostomella pinea]
MKRIRIDRLSSQLLAATPARPPPSSNRIPRALAASRLSPAPSVCQTRCQSTAASPEVIYEDAGRDVAAPKPIDYSKRPLPSPHPDRALRSAKLAALHARLSLSSKIPLQTLARTLIDPSADAHPRFNNVNLAFVGAALLQYHTSEFLVTRYPRLPMTILFAAMKGYAGVPALHQIARAWGIEAAATPGEEVDPGLLQFAPDRPTVTMNRWGYVRAESKELQRYKWRRGVSSRILYDDAFGELVPGESEQSHDGLELSKQRNTKDMIVEDVAQNAHANFVRAVIGAVYLHCGRDVAKTFAKAHVLSRQLDLANLFNFKLPTRELVRLCARENFDAPVARLLSETGRLSRTPVFVVGIYSGTDKLGEGVGPSLDAARISAAINALKSWYLYSPGDTVGVPSDTLAEDAAPWKPVYVDIGEIIS